MSKETESKKQSWFARLKTGLVRSSSKLNDGIVDIFTKRKLDDEALEELEELLITADMGVNTAAKLASAIAKTRFDKDVDPREIREALAAEITHVLAPIARPIALDRNKAPHVILMVGVNGSGKTTTIAKLAARFKDEGHKVMLVAGDTFRAAAIEQLRIWGERTGCPVIAREAGADAAGLAYEAIEQARHAGADVVLIDTAGRLHNRSDLMDELKKLLRVIRKLDKTAPHDIVLTLDATTGQNALSQVSAFRELVEVSGLVLTKLDGSARGGVLVALAEKFDLPVHAIGVGESVEDLRAFEAEDFAHSLMCVGQASPPQSFKAPPL